MAGFRNQFGDNTNGNGYNSMTNWGSNTDVIGDNPNYYSNQGSNLQNYGYDSTSNAGYNSFNQSLQRGNDGLTTNEYIASDGSGFNGNEPNRPQGMGNWGKANIAIKGASALYGAINANEQLKLGRANLAQQKNEFSKNYAMRLNAFNENQARYDRTRRNNQQS